MQAFDAPWPIIQANAVYLACSILALSDDQHILAIYYSQVIGKISRLSMLGQEPEVPPNAVLFIYYK